MPSAVAAVGGAPSSSSFDEASSSSSSSSSPKFKNNYKNLKINKMTKFQKNLAHFELKRLNWRRNEGFFQIFVKLTQIQS